MILNKSVTRTIKDLGRDPTKHYIGKGTFAIALSMYNFYDKINYLDQADMFTVSFQNTIMTLNSEGDVRIKSTEIPHGNCGDSFPLKDKELYDRIRIQNAICPLSDDYFLSSNFLGDEMSIFEIKVSKCTNTTENNNFWKSDEEIDSALQNINFIAYIISTYFDFNDYENPIKTYVDDTDYFNIRSTSLYYDYEVKVQQNHAYMIDNPFFDFGYKKVSFYNADSRSMITNSIGNQREFLSLSIKMDNTSDEYERVVYSFLDMFGFLGGLFDFMYFIGYFWTQYFSNTLFFNNIFSKIYQVEVSQENDRKDVTITKMDAKSNLASQDYSSNEIDKNSNLSEIHMNRI